MGCGCGCGCSGGGGPGTRQAGEALVGHGGTNRTPDSDVCSAQLQSHAAHAPRERPPARVSPYLAAPASPCIATPPTAPRPRRHDDDDGHDQRPRRHPQSQPHSQRCIILRTASPTAPPTAPPAIHGPSYYTQRLGDPGQLLIHAVRCAASTASHSHWHPPAPSPSARAQRLRSPTLTAAKFRLQNSHNCKLRRALNQQAPLHSR